MRKLSNVIFKNRLHGLGQRGVKQHNGHHIFTEWLRDAGELLGQQPHADVCMAGRKAEFHELSGVPFHIFGGRAVIKDYQDVGAFKNKTRYFQTKLHFVLLADDNKQLRISLSEAVEGLVISERWADEHDVIKPASKRPTELVQEELRFA